MNCRFNHIRLFVPVILLVTFAGSASQAAAQGCFQRATGVRTPEPIRRIAPNGLSYTPRPAPTSSLPMVSQPYIGRDGRVYGYSSNTVQQPNGQRAGIPRNSSGQAYWTYKGLKPVRAPEYDRGPTSGPGSLGNPAAGVTLRQNKPQAMTLDRYLERSNQQQRRQLQQAQRFISPLSSLNSPGNHNSRSSARSGNPSSSLPSNDAKQRKTSSTAPHRCSGDGRS